MQQIQKGIFVLHGYNAHQIKKSSRSAQQIQKESSRILQKIWNPCGVCRKTRGYPPAPSNQLGDLSESSSNPLGNAQSLWGILRTSFANLNCTFAEATNYPKQILGNPKSSPQGKLERYMKILWKHPLQTRIQSSRIL